MTDPTVHEPSSPRLLTFASGGWVLLLAGALSLAVVAWRVSAMVGGAGGGEAGFDLGHLRVPPEQLAAPAGRSAVPLYRDGRALTPAEAEGLRRFLVPSDRVIGVVLGGEACAFPLRLLSWHEVIEHELGGVPVAVTWSPLAASAAVYDRRLGGETLELAASGRLFNSTTLLYDRRPGAAGESLWSQLRGDAVAGPAAAAGRRLERLPYELVPWSVWKAEHPDTRVMGPAPAHAKLYSRDPYSTYLGSDELQFPVAPLPPPGLPRKAPVVAVTAGGLRRVYPLAAVAARAGSEGVWRTRQGAVDLELRWYPAGPAVQVRAPGGEPVEALHAAWFAWYSHHPDDALLFEAE